MAKKIKVLTIGDHPLSPSGVGTQSKYVITALLDSGKFSVYSIGGALKHDDYGIKKTDQYGDDWHIPFKRHSKVPGKNFSGAVKDSNMEEGFLHALGRGWIPHYPDAHPWPLQIDHTTTEVSYQWIKKHEHPEIFDYGIKLDNLPPSERAYVTGQLYRIMATDLKNKLAKLL